MKLKFKKFFQKIIIIFVSILCRFLTKLMLEKMIRYVSLHATSVWEGVISRKHGGLAGLVIEGLLRSYLNRFVLKPQKEERRYVLCHFRGLGDSLSFFHTIWLAEKAGMKPFDFIPIEHAFHSEIIRFLFGLDRHRTADFKMLEEWLSKYDKEEEILFCRWRYQLSNYLLHLVGEILKNDEWINLENLFQEVDYSLLEKDLNTKSDSYRKRHRQLMEDAKNYQAYQAPIKYSKWYDQFFRELGNYPGYCQATALELRQKLNIHKPYICLQIRNINFDADRMSNIHDVRVYRNAIKTVISRGYQIVLMGSDSPDIEKLASKEDLDSIVDYKNSGLCSLKNDFLIVSKASFFWGCCSGPTCFAHLFGIPVLMVNMINFSMAIQMSNHRFFPKKYSRKNEGEIPVSELIQKDYHFTLSRRELDSVGVELIEMNSEEMEESVSEFLTMVENPHHDWSAPTSEQKKFQSLFDRSHYLMYFSKGFPLQVWCKKQEFLR